ncbi:MAG TPA: glycine oxidase ThiO [Candidatus Acidoferrum sp.]|nr:glycine oxidase ThiO [Candidatus Acidoferrum sp.]
MKTVDVAIAGAGLIGVAAALELRTRGLTVTVLDRQEPGREASFAAAGMLAPSPDDLSSLPLVPLGKSSIALYPEFVAHIEQASGKTTGFAQKGTLELFFGADGESERDRFMAERKRIGIAVEPLSVLQAREMEPSLTSQVFAAAWLYQEAIVNPRLLIDAAISAAKAGGVGVLANCTVTGLVREANRCTGVLTSDGPISAGCVVIAAGCFSVGIGAEIAPYAPTIPVRGQMLALRAPAGTTSIVALRHVIRSANGYLVPHDDGRIVAGSTLENGVQEKIVTSAGMGKIQGAAIEMVPALKSAEIVETWAGLRPGTPDGLPILGPTDIQGLVIATGHYRNGILLAPITAKLVVPWALGLTIDRDLAAFSPMRFVDRRSFLPEEPPSRQAAG